MSRVGKNPIEIPKGVTVNIDGNLIKVKGPKGELERELHPNIKLEADDTAIKVLPIPVGRTTKVLLLLAESAIFF